MAGIITGQKIESSKIFRARELRHHMTPAEKVLWEALRTNRLQGLHFRRQQIIDGFIVDFYCHAARLVVEVDGDIHQQQPDYDQDRDRILAARGLRILRFKDSEILQDLERVLAQIAKVSCESLSPPSLGEGPGERS